MAVYRDLEQAELDAQLNPRVASPASFHHLRRWSDQSAALRLGTPGTLDLTYGDSPEETLDLFRVPDRIAPLVVFIHGGEWQTLDKADFAFLAPPFLASGVGVALVNYGAAPDTSLGVMVERCRRAVAWLYRNAVDHDLDPTRILLAGHGAGAQLALAAASESWRPYELLGNPVSSVVGLGGLYDLEPVRLSYLNTVLHLDRETAQRLSPLHRPPPPCRVWLVTGGRESLEIRRQARSLSTAWSSQGCPVEVQELPGEDHYGLLDRLAAPKGGLRETLLLHLKGD